jgi:hypothetical protein
MEFKNNFEKKCKCGETFTPYRTFDKLCYVCTKTKQALKNLEAIKKTTKKKQREDLMTLQDYFKIAQTHFNKYIRMRDAEKTCISCGKQLRKGNIDAGHLWSAGGHSNVRFNELNVHAQCSRPCNKDKSGDINNYRLGFIKRFGAAKLAELDLIANLERRYTKDELKELTEVYKAKCKELIK